MSTRELSTSLIGRQTGIRCAARVLAAVLAAALATAAAASDPPKPERQATGKDEAGPTQKMPPLPKLGAKEADTAPADGVQCEPARWSGKTPTH
ncbi:hypothetical protein [Rhodobium gokarnense]|uniref:Opacity protein-like surface antigen n=1 Tax=Rhodobium gokarnense TaxID=364296 RepID=A0ABT3HCQ4_9HYPH|nr:hypothetical protein [Rhodobium gokarnense]MCW2308129.1 opacity protein-like surface antigen [Rhodobium gokarnense]